MLAWLKHTACSLLEKILQKSKLGQLPKTLIKFCRLLSFIDCRSVPKILFTRACRDQAEWLRSGELGLRKPALVRVPSWLLTLFHPLARPKTSPPDATNESAAVKVVELATELGVITVEEPNGLPHLEQYCVHDDWRNRLRGDLPSPDALVCLFDVLALVLQAFPDSHAELLWEELEAQLWDVIESTCLPLLAVIDIHDVLNQMSSNSIVVQGGYLKALPKFLLRISIIMGKRTPPAVAKLQKDALRVLREYYDLQNLGSVEPSLMSLTDTLYLSPLATQIQNYEYRRHNRRLNAVLGFALAIVVVERDAQLAQLSHQISQWGPLIVDMPSTMEILAQVHLQGTAIMTQVFAPSLESFALHIKVLIGFCAVRQQSFETALEILEANIIEVRKEYGKSSLEYLFTGIELVKCHNFLSQEDKGEALASRIWSDIIGPPGREITVHSQYQSYLMITMADSLLGQAKFDDAEELLLRTLDYPTISSAMIVSASLRLLKMSRRQRKEHPTFDTWDMLEKAVCHLGEVSDVLKYECFEETMCFTSILDQKDPAQVLRARNVMNVLSHYSVKHYSGSKVSKQNLKDHMHALRRYRKEFELFTVSGPQLHYCRIIRDRFPAATINFIERIGTANWERFNRVKELPALAKMIDEVCHGDEKSVSGPSKSTFRDSALGSSLQTGSRVARSHTSYHSLATSFEAGFAKLPATPDEVSKKKPFECQICSRKIKDVTNKAQWERHVYADLQPYVCIMNDCRSSFASFSSRAEFAAHLTEHEFKRVWKCKKCGKTQEDVKAAREHVLQAHKAREDTSVADAIQEIKVVRNLAEQRCPFCAKVPGAVCFVGHICHHLEEVALAVLPHEVDCETDSDKGESGNISCPSGGDSPCADSTASEIEMDRAKNVDKTMMSSMGSPRTGIATLGSLHQDPVGGHAGYGHAYDDDDSDDEDYQGDEQPRDLFANFSRHISLGNRGFGIAAPKAAVTKLQTENANAVTVSNNAARGLYWPKTSSSAMASPVRTRSRSRHRDPPPQDPDYMSRENHELERTRKELERYKLDEKRMNRPTYTRMARRYLSIETLRELRIDYTLDTDPSYILIQRWVPEYEQDFLWNHTRELRELRALQQKDDGFEIVRKKKKKIVEFEIVSKQKRKTSPSPLVTFFAGGHQ